MTTSRKLKVWQMHLNNDCVVTFWSCSGDYTKVRCLHCPKIISKGPSGTAKKNLSATGMETHLRALHPEAAAAATARDELRQQGRVAEAAAAAQRDETATGLVKIFNLRTNLQRTTFLDMVSAAFHMIP
jgi:hypothetical protein